MVRISARRAIVLWARSLATIWCRLNLMRALALVQSQQLLKGPQLAAGLQVRMLIKILC